MSEQSCQTTSMGPLNVKVNKGAVVQPETHTSYSVSGKVRSRQTQFIY